MLRAESKATSENGVGPVPGPGRAPAVKSSTGAQRHGQHAAEEAAQDAEQAKPPMAICCGQRHVVRAGRLGAARPAEKRRAVDAHEAGGGKRGGQRQHGADGRRGEVQRGLRQRRRGQDRLEQQPLRNEAVERRQGRDRERTHQEEDRGARHAVDETAQPIEIAPPGGVQHRAGAEEQQRLEPRMIEHMQQRRRHRHRRRLVLGRWRGRPAPGPAPRR